MSLVKKEDKLIEDMGLVKKEEDNDPPRTQIARLDGLKVKSRRLKRCSASLKPRGSPRMKAVIQREERLNRLKAKSPLMKEIIEREEAFRDAMGGEIAIIKYYERHMPKPKPKFDSQGFQIYPEQGISETKRSLVRDASSRIPRKPCWINYTAYFLYEFAYGYALFEAHGVNELYLSNLNIPGSIHFKSHEGFLKCSDQIFTLKAFHPFSSNADALVQMNAISNSRLSQQLKSFLADNLPKPYNASFYVTTCDPFLLAYIQTTLRVSIIGGVRNNDLIRGLRMNIGKYIDGLKPKDVEKAQKNLARLYSRQMCSTMYVESSLRVSSSSLQAVMVVPHRLEGVFIAKGKEDFICTRNLVPGESLYAEELIFIQNEDGTEVEYKVWNPLRSKLAGAILCGVTNIWVKPGSRILYLGDDVCPITVSHLSDLVGLDGLVYVVGLSDVAVNIAEKRSNVVAVYQNPSNYLNYRMVVGMVDVIYAEYIHPDKVNNISNNVGFYLRAGGHYMVYTRVNNIYLTSRGKDPFAMAVGGFRMLEE